MATSDEKDRLGELLREVEKGREDQFFAERDRELVRKLREKRQADVGATTSATAPPDRCPKCGALLQRRDDGGVPIDACRRCGTAGVTPARSGG